MGAKSNRAGRYSYVSRKRGIAHKRIEGHALVNRSVTTTETAVCKCGRVSAEPLSNNKRRVWHNVHLDNVTFRMANPGDIATVIMRKTGISYRQLDHWARRGYIPSKSAGSGVSRIWEEDAIFIALEMARLVRSGFTNDVAADLARTIVTNPSATDTYTLKSGVVITLTTPPSSKRKAAA